MPDSTTKEATAGPISTTTSIDPVQRIADKQAEWRALSVADKATLLQEILDTINNTLDVDTVIEWLGQADATMMGFRPETTVEGQFEATQVAFLYTVVLQGAVQKLLAAYQVQAGTKAPLKLEITETNRFGRVTVQTLPVLTADKFGPFGKTKSELWLKEGVTDCQTYQVESFLRNDNTHADGCMVVLGAGNHCFLSAVDCLHGLFVKNSVVFLKHHPLRGHHDVILRRILQPLIDRGYFDSERDSGLARTREIVYHPAVSRVHLTGGKATHDAIVWGNDKKQQQQQRQQPLLQAEMTSELGCVTPWIVAPQAWTDAQLEHQVQHLFGSMYNNAGANCNSPKVVIMTRDWPHAADFCRKLVQEMERAPLPVAYYPGSMERWNGFRQAYPDGKEYGDVSLKAIQQRGLQPDGTVLPWLVVDDLQVDLSTQEGRQRAANEYAFRHEPFAPVVTIVYVDSLETAVILSNEYLYGSLSCSLIAPDTTDDRVEQAIADLKYGSVAVNTWAAMCYAPSGGCTWGAFPGETLDNVESGIGQINNYFFIPGVEKSVLRSVMVDAIHSTRQSNLVAARNEFRATAGFLLKPGVWAFLNLLTAAAVGRELPRASSIVTGLFAKPLSLVSKLWRRERNVNDSS